MGAPEWLRIAYGPDLHLPNEMLVDTAGILWRIDPQQPTFRAVMSRELGAIAIAALLTACGPTAGDPCEPDPLAEPVATHWDLTPLPPRAAYYPISLYCTGPAGCGAETEFAYRSGMPAEPTLFPAPVYCGCDGRTYAFPIYALTRWRHAGSCDTCESVSFSPASGWGTAPDPISCTACAGARLDNGACVGSDGMPRSWSCCECHLDSASQCIAVSGDVVHPSCCGVTM